MSSGVVAWHEGRGTFFIAASSGSSAPTLVHEVAPTSLSVLGTLELSAASVDSLGTGADSGEVVLSLQELSPTIRPAFLVWLDPSTEQTRPATFDRSLGDNDDLFDGAATPLPGAGLLFVRSTLVTAEGRSPDEIGVLMWLGDGELSPIEVETPELVAQDVAVSRDGSRVLVAGWLRGNQAEEGVWIAELNGGSPASLARSDWTRVIGGRFHMMVSTDTGFAVISLGMPGSLPQVWSLDWCE